MRSSADRAAMSPGGLAVSEVRRAFRAWPYRQARWAAARGAQQREVARSPSLKGLFAQRVSLPVRRWADMAHCPGVINASRNREAVSLHSVSIASPHGLQAYHISPALRRRLISPERLRGTCCCSMQLGPPPVDLLGGNTNAQPNQVHRGSRRSYHRHWCRASGVIGDFLNPGETPPPGTSVSDR
jgi:hypothetical protein